MIELYEGVPGSGKSYHGIAEKFLPWVRQGRRLYIYVDGIYLDRLALFTGIEVAQLQQQITVWKNSTEVLSSFPHIEPGSAVIIDEAQTVFRSMQKVEPGLLRWLETHRHYGVDILLMCQDYRQMSQGVTRLIEATIRFRKLSFVGLNKKYQGKVRGNPEDTELIRAFVGTYSPAVYAYYSSYANAAIHEEQRRHSVLKSARVVVGLVAGLFALALMLWRPWTSLQSGVRKPGTSDTPSASAMKPSSHPVADSWGSTAQTRSAAQGITLSIRIIGGGGMTDPETDEEVWRYLLDSGELLTATEISGRYGLTVHEVHDKGFTRLVGEGIVYGPSRD
ncbi:MAG: zonular occludens toxin domain-containing protein [Nitrospiraceae bacterium]